MGGFPTTAFLTPEGELLTGAGYLDVDGMRQVLESVRQMWADKGRSAGRVPRARRRPPAEGELTDAIESHLAGQIEAKYDDGARRLGVGREVPASSHHRVRVEARPRSALRTLDAVRDHLADDVAGGFFRFAGTPDWGDVAYEKPIDTNAASPGRSRTPTSTRATRRTSPRDRRGRLSHRRPLDRLRRWRERRPGARTRLLRRLRRGPRRTRPASPGPDRLRGRERALAPPTHCSRSPPTPTTRARAPSRSDPRRARTRPDRRRLRGSDPPPRERRGRRDGPPRRCRPRRERVHPRRWRARRGPPSPARSRTER